MVAQTEVRAQRLCVQPVGGSWEQRAWAFLPLAGHGRQNGKIVEESRRVAAVLLGPGLRKDVDPAGEAGKRRGSFTMTTPAHGKILTLGKRPER